MSKQHHYLKTETEYYQQSESGKKMFEVRFNDRDYRVGDMVYLQEVVNGKETGRTLPPAEITYIFMGGNYGLGNGYVVLQLR